MTVHCHLSDNWRLRQHPPSCERQHLTPLLRKSVIALALLLVCSSILTTACSKHRAYVVKSKQTVTPEPSAETVISETPPPPPQELVVASPGPGYCWIPGYWSWQGRWIWVRGAWSIPPYPHAVYVPGRWVHRGHGYVWITGHWR